MKVIQRGRGDHRTLEESRLSSASHRVGKTKKTSAEGMKDYIRRINDEKLSTAKNQSN